MGYLERALNTISRAETILSQKQTYQIVEIEAMPLTKFAQTNLAIKVDSSVLAEIVYFVSNDVKTEQLKAEGFVVYTAKELAHLAQKGLTPDELRKIHEVKKLFSGKIIH